MIFVYYTLYYSFMIVPKMQMYSACFKIHVLWFKFIVLLSWCLPKIRIFMCLFLLQYNRNTRIVKQKFINVLKRNVFSVWFVWVIFLKEIEVFDFCLDPRHKKYLEWLYGACLGVEFHFYRLWWYLPTKVSTLCMLGVQGHLPKLHFM